MPFEKGCAPGPGAGRRKLPSDVYEFLYGNRMKAAHAIVEALEATKWVGNESPMEVADYKMRVEAAEILYNRLFGKPAQTISGDDGGPVRVDIASIVGALSKLAGDGDAT